MLIDKIKLLALSALREKAIAATQLYLSESMQEYPLC